MILRVEEQLSKPQSQCGFSCGVTFWIMKLGRKSQAKYKKFVNFKRQISEFRKQSGCKL